VLSVYMFTVMHVSNSANKVKTGTQMVDLITTSGMRKQHGRSIWGGGEVAKQAASRWHGQKEPS